MLREAEEAKLDHKNSLTMAILGRAGCGMKVIRALLDPKAGLNPDWSDSVSRRLVNVFAFICDTFGDESH